MRLEKDECTYVKGEDLDFVMKYKIPKLHILALFIEKLFHINRQNKGEMKINTIQGTQLAAL